MKNTMRNLTFSAAALAALMAVAPKAAAQDHGRGRRDSGRQEQRHDGRGYRAPGYGSNGGFHNEWRDNRRHYVPPSRYYGPRYYGSRYYGSHFVSPFRVFSGFRFYSAYPGPGYVYIAGFGWVVPPFFGAVWVPGHYDIDGYWVEGFWH